jgi:hypothetical protein
LTCKTISEIRSNRENQFHSLFLRLKTGQNIQFRIPIIDDLIMKKLSEVFRILIIEDNQQRIDTFKNWIPEKTPIVVASSAGKAIGILKRDSNKIRKNGRVYAGILLDRDLQGQTVTDIDQYLSGNDIIDVIISSIDKDVPILIHSTNIHQSIKMKQQLEGIGYPVTKIPMTDLTKEKFNEWIDEAFELWKDSLGIE